MKKVFLLFLMLIIACFIIIGCKDSSNNTNNSSNANVGVLRDLSVNLEKNYSVPDSDSNVIELASTPDELFSHSNSFSIEMEKDAADNEAKGKVYREKFAKEKGVKTSATGLVYKVEKEGTGAAPKDSDTVVVNYKGTLIDGKEFDNSYTRGEPLSFRLDGVIPGWTEGLKNIKKGGKIQLVIPPDPAYGKTGVPGIPANSTLVFDVELLDIKPAPKADAQPDAAPADKAADSSKK